MLDKNRIFGVFEVNIEKPPKGEYKPEDYSTAKNIRLFIEYNLKFLDFRDFSESIHKKNPKDFDYDATMEVGEAFLLNRGWEFLNKVDYNNPKHVSSIRRCKNSNFIHCLNFSIKYYEYMENYEVCSYLLKIKNIKLKRKDN
jgi:hypothetical protein